MKLLYNLLLWLAAPAVAIFFACKNRQAGGNLPLVRTRFGFYDKKSQKIPTYGIWLHAASVGEVVLAKAVVDGLRQRFPRVPITLTTMTVTGMRQAQKVFAHTPNIALTYLPYDLPFAVQSFLQQVKPRLGIILETEIWANLYNALHDVQVPFVIANARLSERSQQGYARFKASLAPILNQTSLIAAQDRASAERYTSLGVKAEKLHVMGNLKYDLSVPSTANVAQSAWQNAVGDRPIWVAASTHEGEDPLILQAHRQLLKTLPNVLLILVPRHPERFDSVAKLISDERFTLQRRSDLNLSTQQVNTNTQVLLGDSMGELLNLYALADIAFVAGSLIPHGGHNPLEPLALGKPVISGSYVQHFQKMYDDLNAVQGVCLLPKTDDVANELACALQKWFKNSDLALASAERGQQVLNQNRGALDNFLNTLDERNLTKPFLKP